jgi:outer membrane translocation and assembly module TamA
MTRTFIALLAALLAAAVPASAAQGELEEVTALRFEGNEVFSDRVLSASIMTRSTECRGLLLKFFCWAGSSFAMDERFLGPREFERDVVRLRLFYYRHGYREALILPTLNRTGEGVQITFSIEEGTPVLIDTLAFNGLDPPADLDLLEDLPVRMGEPLDQMALGAARDSLTIRLRNAGYAHAEVLLDILIPAAQPYRARVNFDVFKGAPARFGPISIEGNERVDQGVILGMIPFREGSTYDAELVFEARRSLYGLEVFSNVGVTEELDAQPDSVIPVSVSVVEGDIHRYRAGAGWSTADCVNAEASWTSRNFSGGGRRLQFLGRLSNILNSPLNSTLCRDAGIGPYGRYNWSLSAQFSQPRLFSLRTTFAANVFWERQSLPDLFVRQSLGVDLSLTRGDAAGRSQTIFFQPTTGKLDAADVFFCSSFLVCDLEGIGVLQRSNWLSPVGIRLAHEGVGQGFGPARGYSLGAEIEHASRLTGSDFTYNLTVVEAAGFRELRGGLVVAGRLRGGRLAAGGFGALGREVGSEIAHPQKRFYAGGATSVRGFAHNQLGPRVLFVGVETLLGAEDGGTAPCTPDQIIDYSCDPRTLDDDRFTSNPTGGSRLLEGNVEVRFPLSSGDWQGTLFLDFGQVWSGGASQDPARLEWTPGMGVRYFTAIGPLRLDLAYRLSGGAEQRVLTSGIRPYHPASDQPEERLAAAPDFVRSGRLEILPHPVFYGESADWSLSRLQLHLSLGQVF